MNVRLVFGLVFVVLGLMFLAGMIHVMAVVRQPLDIIMQVEPGRHYYRVDASSVAIDLSRLTPTHAMVMLDKPVASRMLISIVGPRHSVNILYLSDGTVKIGIDKCLVCGSAPDYSGSAEKIVVANGTVTVDGQILMGGPRTISSIIVDIMNPVPCRGVLDIHGNGYILVEKTDSKTQTINTTQAPSQTVPGKDIQGENTDTILGFGSLGIGAYLVYTSRRR